MRPDTISAVSYVREEPGGPTADEQRNKIERAAVVLELSIVSHYEDTPIDMPGLTFSIGGIAHVLDLVPDVGRLLVWDRSRLRVPGWPEDEDPVALLKAKNVRIIDVGDLNLPPGLPVLARSRPRPRPPKTESPKAESAPSGSPTSNQLVGRLTRGRYASAKRGNHVSGPVPYGYQRNASDHSLIEPREDEAEIVRMIFRLYCQRRASMNRVIRELETLGLKTRNGKKWSRAGISWLVSNPVYVGKIRYLDSTVPGRHKAIISNLAFHQANKLRVERNKLDPRRANSLGAPLGS